MARNTRFPGWAALVWVGVWQAGSMALNQPLLLPSPLSALARLGELAVTAAFWRSVGLSAGRILGGFFLGCALGTLCAVLSGWRRLFRDLFAPLTAAIKAVPVASFVILALMLFSSRSLSVLIAGLVSFPPVYLGVLEGIDRADRRLLEMARVFRVSLSRRAADIYLPAVLPPLRTAVSLAMGLCWKAGVAAEVIGLPAGTLGERLYTAKVYFLTADLFAWTAVVVAVSAGFERLLLLGLDALGGGEGAP